MFSNEILTCTVKSLLLIAEEATCLENWGKVSVFIYLLVLVNLLQRCIFAELLILAHKYCLKTGRKIKQQNYLVERRPRDQKVAGSLFDSWQCVLG